MMRSPEPGILVTRDMSDPRRFPELDVLRVIGAVGIVSFHYTFRGFAADGMCDVSFPIIGDFSKYGYLATYLFFILSGLATACSAQKKDLPGFIRSRCIRLYPTFWVCVSLTAAASYVWGGDRYRIDLLQYAMNLTMLGGYLGVEPVDTAYWFLFVLQRFYLLVAVLVFTGLIKHYRYAAGVWLALALALTGYDLPGAASFLVRDEAAFFISGMIFLSARTAGWDIYKTIVIAASFVSALYTVLRQVPDFNAHYHTGLSYGAVAGILASIYLSLVAFSCCRKPIRLPAGISLLGLATYPFYLLHQHIGFMLLNAYGHLLDKHLVLLTTISLMALLSLGITRHVEPAVAALFRRRVSIATDGCPAATPASLETPGRAGSRVSEPHGRLAVARG